MKKIEKRKLFKKHLGRVGLAALSLVFISTPVNALEPKELISETLGNDGGQELAKEAFNNALKIAKSKPALSVAAGITCLACVPAAGAAASPGLCIACGILIAKTLG